MPALPKFFFEKDKTKKPHDALWMAFRALRNPYASLHSEWVQYARHYNHRHWNRSIGSTSNLDAFPNPGGANKITLNVVKNICDTKNSKICKHQPDIAVMAPKDDAESEFQADYVEKFLRERRRFLKVEQLKRETHLQACIYGTGVLKIDFDPEAEAETEDGFKSIGEIKVKSKLPYEVFVDFEMLGNQPPNWIIELEWVHLLELQQKHPGVNFMVEIGKAEFPNRQNTTGVQSQYIPVLHLYHKSTSYMKKGRHIMATQTATLVDEDYDSKHLPFLFLHDSKSPASFWGIGVAKRLRSMQIEIDKILYHISQNQNFLGRPKLFLGTDGNIMGADQNGIGVVTGSMEPKIITGNPTPPEVREHLQFLIQQCFETEGMSQAMATGEPPPAVRSALAMEHMAERENDRFALNLLAYEDFDVALAERILYLSHKHYKKDDKRWFKAIVDSRRFEVLEFEKLKLEDYQYQLNIVSANALAHTKAGQIDAIINLAQMGIIKDPTMILDLMRVPNEDKTYDSVLLDTRIAREENLRMSQGEQVAISEFEDHDAHIKEHMYDIKTKKFENEPVSVQQAKADHLHQHIALKTKAQQQEQQQQMQAIQAQQAMQATQKASAQAGQASPPQAATPQGISQPNKAA